MKRYKVTFEAYVRIEAENTADAIKNAWLNENLDNATYKYIRIKEEKEK